MPVYEYACRKCGKHFEVEQRITEQPIDRCNDKLCGGEAARTIPATSFTLRGSGWFKSGGY